MLSFCAARQLVAVEAAGQVAVGDDVRPRVAARLGLGEDGLRARGVVDVAVGVDDRFDGCLGVVLAQVVEDAAGEDVRGGVHEEDALLADEGADVAEGGEEDDAVGDGLRFAEGEEGCLFGRQAAC